MVYEDTNHREDAYENPMLISNAVISPVEGFIYVYLTNESNAEAYFDDITVTIKESAIVQNTNYYPYGLSHNTSWTRPTDLKNNYLYNAGSELNEMTKNYETFYRNYDPALGRFNGVDIMATAYHSASPYSFAGNNPINYNDPMGDMPQAFLDEMKSFYGSGRNHSVNLPGMSGYDGGSGRIGHGSGSHWSDQLWGSMGAAGFERNARMMSASTLDSFYGLSEMSDENRFSLAGALSSSHFTNDEKRTTNAFLGSEYFKNIGAYNFKGLKWGWKSWSGDKYGGNGVVQQGGIEFTITNNVTGSAFLKGYPNDVIDEEKGLGIVYEVPVYEAIVSGINKDGKKISKSFNVIRYGVYNGNNGPSVVGVNSGTYNLTWGQMTHLGGAWHVDGAGRGAVWVHVGPANLSRPVGAIGCVELYGNGSWGNFNSYVQQLGGTTNNSAINNFTITFMPAVPPPLTQSPGKYYRP